MACISWVSPDFNTMHCKISGAFWTISFCFDVVCLTTLDTWGRQNESWKYICFCFAQWSQTDDISNVEKRRLSHQYVAPKPDSPIKYKPFCFKASHPVGQISSTLLRSASNCNFVKTWWRHLADTVLVSKNPTYKFWSLCPPTLQVYSSRWCPTDAHVESLNGGLWKICIKFPLNWASLG